MSLQQALKEQLHAGLAMLAECVQKCPDALWTQGEPTRTFGRIAFHAAFFTQWYMGPGEDVFQPWPGRREGGDYGLWERPQDVEPYELPADAEIYRPDEMLGYIRFVDSLVDATVDGLDLDARETGFSQYEGMSKLSHQLMNLRHIQGHVGQLSELLMAQGIDTEWIGQ
jgi:hypothetical protein